MQISRKNLILISVVILAIIAVVLIGNNFIQKKPAEKNYNKTPQENAKIENTDKREVVPTGESAAWNDRMKPILEKVFGKIILTNYSFATDQFIYFKYLLKRFPVNNDIFELAKEFQENGYYLVTVSSKEVQDIAVVGKNNKYIKITFYKDGDSVEISITSNP